jgi:pimeloyl-ACP methyl ester carboxylesterase
MTRAVFVPGLLCTDELFESQRRSLSGTLEMFIGDHRSHKNFASMATHILGNAPEKFVFAGLSMGGYAGFEIMRQAPERVEALILMNTSSRPDAPKQTERRRGLIEIANSQGLDAVVDAVLPGFLAEQHQGNSAMTDTVRRMAGETGVETFLNQVEAIIGRMDSRPLLQMISCPTLVIVGANDTLTPPELAREIVAGVSDTQLAVIEDCGHLSTVEQPEAVSRAIKTFMEDVAV